MTHQPTTHAPAQFSNLPASSPLIQTVTYDQFAGIPARWLDVPAGNVGLVLQNRQVTKQLQPGRRTVVSWTQMLLSKASAVQVALIYTEPVSEMLPVAQGLSTADNEAVDLSACITIRVTDPIRLYQSNGTRVSSLSAGEVLVGLVTKTMERQLAQAIKERPLPELDKPPAQKAIEELLHQTLIPIVEQQGIEIERVDYLLAQPAEDIVSHWKDLQELKARLAQVNLDVALDAAERQAQAQEMVRQMEYEYGLPPGSLAKIVERKIKDQAEETTKAGLIKEIEAMQAQLQIGLQERHRRLRQRVKSEPATAAESPVTPPWWLNWIGVLKGVGYLLFLFFLGLALFLPSQVLLGVRVLLIVIGLALALITFWLALYLDQQAARRQARWYARHPLTAFNDGDLQQTDGLVRQQVATELAHVGQVMQEVRRRVYRQELEELALRLGDVQRWAERLVQQVQQTSRGGPLYLNHSIESWDWLEQSLHYDEQLLDLTAATGEMAQELRQAALTGDHNLLAKVTVLETHLADLEHTFSARSRVIIESNESN